MSVVPLPIDPFLPEIRSRARDVRAVVVTAAPGAGKTTRVPAALAVDGPVIVLQPRRVAARSLAARVALERGWTIGREVGWHVRFERRFSATTSVLFATEGILTARLQQDPLLSDFRTVILDEFHERSIHADLGIALAKQAWRARSDLALIVMSATLDARAVSTYLDGCPVVDVPGVTHPLDIRYAPHQTLGQAVTTCLESTAGQVLCFLPGAGEIATAAAELRTLTSRAEIVELHGSLDAAAQDAAIAEGSRRRVILATNIAETSLTVPGVSAVVDRGLHKVARYDPDRAVDSLVTERISEDAANQRSGRAARLGPGIALRLWPEHDRLRPHREPEIQRIDLAATVLDVMAWGGNPQTFEWFDAPSASRVDAALDLLTKIGALTEGRLTDLGRKMQRLPLGPRLSAILLAADGAPEAAMTCALLSERQVRTTRGGGAATTTNDALSAIERGLPPHVTKVARLLQTLVGAERARRMSEPALGRAILAGYPDRVAWRREAGSPRVLLSSGHGATIDSESGVRGGEFIVALDVVAGKPGQAEARVRMAAQIDRSWLKPTHSRVEHALDENSGTVRAVSTDYYDALILAERPVPVDQVDVERLLIDAWLARPEHVEEEQLLRRLRFAGLGVTRADLVRRAAHGARALREIDVEQGLSFDDRQRVDRAAPRTLMVPSGREARLDYQADGSVTAAVKLQELFGLADTPLVGPGRVPVLFALLAPNGRPVQMTKDLRSFWERTYPEVRKELRGRYPRHPWPEDPWSAPPTARTKKRGV